MATVKITKSAIQSLANEGKNAKEIAEALNIPVSKAKEAIKALGIKLKRASKGGLVFVFEDDTVMEETQTESNAVLDTTPKEVEEPALKAFLESEQTENISTNDEKNPLGEVDTIVPIDTLSDEF